MDEAFVWAIQAKSATYAPRPPMSPNIIPDEATLSGTYRLSPWLDFSFNWEDQEELQEYNIIQHNRTILGFWV